MHFMFMFTHAMYALFSKLDMNLQVPVLARKQYLNLMLSSFAHCRVL